MFASMQPAGDFLGERARHIR